MNQANHIKTQLIEDLKIMLNNDEQQYQRYMQLATQLLQNISQRKKLIDELEAEQL
jgi:hypothetical protein